MKFLMFLSQNYSFEILRPIQKQLLQAGDDVLWFVFGIELNTQLFKDDERFTSDVKQAVNFKPDAVFVPGNKVPSFIPGIKVQVFHGFEWKKKGHFKIRECFDLYCTQGPFFTEKFAALAEKHDFFDVVETGWPKLDPLFSAKPLQIESFGKPIVLYAPTFSPSLTSVPDLYDDIIRLSKQTEFHWLVKFHPKMDAEWVEKFKQVQHANLQVLDVGEISQLLQTADILISDTSSIITEFLMLEKPVITYKNVAPEAVLIDITQPQQLDDALEQASSIDEVKKEEIKQYVSTMNPYTDGQSATRIIDATKHIVEHGKVHNKPLPKNWFRNFKMRKIMGYWGW